MQISTAASWRNELLRLPRDIGRAAVSILTGRPRVSDHRRLNSSPIRWGSSMTGIAPPVIVGPRFMRAGPTATRHRAVGIAGSLGTGTIADMAVMGKGR